jgi:hypothetical protein
MIISASYKTDIPAFYGRWFLNRLDAGYCRMINPYGRQIHNVDLRPEAVDGFVFWTRNAGPFMDALAVVHQRGWPFVVQHGINGYPRQLDRSVPDAGRCIEHCRRIAAVYGPRSVVWRYDTIIFSSLTPRDWHLGNFAGIAARMEGVSDEVVISFAQIYRKTLSNMNRAAAGEGFSWHDPADEDKRLLAAELAGMARARGMQLTICSQRSYLGENSADARCIDAARLADVAGRPIAARLRGNRKECGCHQCRDIGDYDTCPHGCIYCYAVRSPQLAAQRFRDHDPRGEFLCTPAWPGIQPPA